MKLFAKLLADYGNGGVFGCNLIYSIVKKQKLYLYAPLAYHKILDGILCQWKKKMAVKSRRAKVSRSVTCNNMAYIFILYYLFEKII